VNGSEDPLEGLSDDELDAVLEHAFERYYSTSGLFGTVARCTAMVERLRAAGVDEIGCLIDFGIDPEVTLAHLPWLNQVRMSSGNGMAAVDSLADTIRHLGVTHLQCTPSLAALLVETAQGQGALGHLACLLVGGDVLAPDLAARLREAVSGSVYNIYGPTEATVWATAHAITSVAGPVPIGRPLGNTIARVVDGRGRPVPQGTPGELVLGGHGVARGYLGRPDLTAERFVADPLGLVAGRLYRTGDRARWRRDGTLEFLGRLDAQVKVRGHRIELGEVESKLRAHRAVRDAVVVVREDVPGDQRLAAFVVLAGSRRPTVVELLADLGRQLPQYMVPAHLVVLDALPLTSNGKIDRRALPSPLAATSARAISAAPPIGDVEVAIADVWSELLGSPVGREDNVFDLGGHSLLAIEAHRRLRAKLNREVSITDLFRFPTVSSLARHIAEGETGSAARRGAELGRRRLAARGQRSIRDSGDGTP
jgi:hypothetical protein